MKIACIGELIVDFICPVPADSIQEASTFVRCPGGSPANVAAWLAPGVHDVVLFSKVGQDSFGRFALEAIRSAGISTNGVAISKRYPTRCVFIAHDGAGSRSIEITNRKSADQELHTDELPASEMENIDLLHIGGTTMLGEKMAETTFSLVAEIKAQGSIVSFDPNINLQRIGMAAKKRICKLLPYVDILKVNEPEWKALREPPFNVHRNPAIVVCTRGEAGAIILSGEQQLEVSAQPSVRIDPTGAGDAFYAGFASSLLLQSTTPLSAAPETLSACGTAGARQAAKIIGQIGGFPNRTEIG